MSFPSTLAGLNELPADQKRETYSQIIPPQLLDLYNISPDLRDQEGRDLFQLNCDPGSPDAELALFHEAGAPDPIIFGHLTDTIHGQIHILLYGMNDVHSPRFNVDRMPNGSRTNFGTNQRNLEEEGYGRQYSRSAFKKRIEAEGRIIGLEADWARHNGTILPIRESTRAVRDGLGNTLYYEGTVEDITEQRRAEKRIKEYQLQLKSLASELSLAEERERRRIAAGIHDDIAQKLAMAKFGLQSLQASVTDGDVSESLEEQCQLMDQIVADARSLTFELSNPALYQVGLEAAIESYLTERIEGQFGLRCTFKSEGPRSSLAEDIRVVLFQAVRELLANIVKHANASTVEVYVSNAEDRLRIVVQDDGVGFDPAKIGPHLVERGGFGLFSIRERLEYLGGNVTIESGLKKGARVTMTVPVKTNVSVQ